MQPGVITINTHYRQRSYRGKIQAELENLTAVVSFVSLNSTTRFTRLLYNANKNMLRVRATLLNSQSAISI